MEAIIFCGIQATGKSTFYKTYFFNTHVRISLDLLKTKNRVKFFLDACLLTNQPFVSDNTNSTRAERQMYIEKAKEYNYKVKGYYFQSKIDDAIRRNEQRTGKQNIPVKGIRNTYGKLELPSHDEGFDELYYVEIIDNGFIVKNWTDEI